MFDAKVRYFIRFQARTVPQFGDMADKCEVLLVAGCDAEARKMFEDFRHRHPTEYGGRIITSSLRLIKEETLAEG